MSWRMDKNKFWHQRKARPQVVRPNIRLQRKRKACPQRKACRHVRKLGAPTQPKARPQRKAKLFHNENVHTRHVRKMGAQTQHKTRPQVRRSNATQGTSASWSPQRTSAMQTQGTSHVRKLGAPTQRKARPQDGRPNAKLIRNENVHTREH
jgi:hypothetical protein